MLQHEPLGDILLCLSLVADVNSNSTMATFYLKDNIYLKCTQADFLKIFFDLFLILERFISSLKAPKQQSVVFNRQSKQQF